MMMPARGSGVNTAERVPSTTDTVPARARSQARAVAFGQVGMQHFHRHAQTLAQPRHGLRRQADFRHQQQRLLAARQHLFDQRQVDLGLAAASDTVQQKRLVLAEARAHLRHRLRLLVAEYRRAGGGARWHRPRLFTAHDQSRRGQAPRRAAPVWQRDIEFARAGRPGMQRRQQRVAGATPRACGQGGRAIGG
jgi:hypothetical protein